tara:strand:- start:233 stop:634 length:402 start_codon:yes stop_codon:yes gene_type:complete
MNTIRRPITPIKDFENAIKSAKLSKSEDELIEYIRYTGIFSQPMIKKDLRLNSKPPALSILCEVSRKIGFHMPNHFNAVREWSKAVSPDGIKWDGDLICSGIRNIDGELLTPEAGTSLYHFLAVHKELFTGLD